jgi:hypothetical protein
MDRRPKAERDGHNMLQPSRVSDQAAESAPYTRQDGPLQPSAHFASAKSFGPSTREVGLRTCAWVNTM